MNNINHVCSVNKIYLPIFKQNNGEFSVTNPITTSSVNLSGMDALGNYNYSLINKKHSSKESFNDVFAEMTKNLPDSTTTIDEKISAIAYINRLLACDDIPNTNYWQNKKDVIEMEILNIKNEQKRKNNNKHE